MEEKNEVAVVGSTALDTASVVEEDGSEAKLYGECRFCQNMITLTDEALEAAGGDSEEAATMLCDCEDAVKYRSRKASQEAAEESIKGISEENPQVAKVLSAARDAIIMNPCIRKVAVMAYTDNLDKSMKYTIKTDKEGNMIVNRVDTSSESVML